MTNKEIIEIINRVSDRKTRFDALLFQEPFIAALHNHYYIKSKKDRGKLLDKAMSIIVNYIGECEKENKECDCRNDEGEKFLTRLAAELVIMIRDVFDENFYNKQIAKISREEYNEHYDANLCKKLMLRCDKRSLMRIYRYMNILNGDSGCFFSAEDGGRMIIELYERCLERGAKIPDMNTDMKKHMAYMTQKPLCYFDYIGVATIANILCKYVSQNHDVLVYMIKKLESCDFDTTAAWCAFAFWLRYTGGIELFDLT